MCGIVGLFCKSRELEPRLGEYLAAMLEQMSDRGPDSAGVAVYRDPAPSGSSKLTLYSFDPEMSWGALRAELAEAFGGAHEDGVRANHAVFVVEGEAADVEDWIRRHRPDVRVMSAGRRASRLGIRAGGEGDHNKKSASQRASSIHCPRPFKRD